MVELKSKLLELMENEKRNFSFEEICDFLEIKKGDTDTRELVGKALYELETTGNIYKSKNDKYMCWHNGLGRYFGVVMITRKGEAYIRDPFTKNIAFGKIAGAKIKSESLRVDKKNVKSFRVQLADPTVQDLSRTRGSKKIKIRKGGLNGALPGDKVILSRLKEKQDAVEGEVEKILERGTENIICEVTSYNGAKCLTPLTSNKDLQMKLDTSMVDEFLIGDRILVHLSTEKDGDLYKAEIVKRLCHKDDPKSDVITKAAEYSFDFEFPDEVKREVEKIPRTIEGEDLSKRVDLRDKVIFTIDGSDTKDIDDAISLEILDNGNYKLGVHIADVSHYVKPGTAIFQEAYKRGTSAYLLDSVFPMLPRELSNGICSLNPEEDRLAKSCEMEITPDGRIVSSKTFNSVIRSRKKMTYETVNKILENGETPKGYEQFRDVLIEMNQLSEAMQKRRIENGAIEFDRPEKKIYTNEEGKFDHITVLRQKSAELLIENFMLAANESVATKTMKHRFPSIYRIHDYPDEDKLDALLELVHLNIPEMTKRNHIGSPKELQEFLDELNQYDQYPIFANMTLRGLSKAVYSDNNIGHYGLGLANYTHFTSPIRRFPDLLLHTLLNIYDKGLYCITDKERDLIDAIPEMAFHSSNRERLEKQAEYDINDMKIAEHLSDKQGLMLEGTVTEITHSLIRVETDDMMEGIVRFSDIKHEGKSHYTYKYKEMSLQSSTEKIRLGDRLSLEVKSASKATGLVSFISHGHVDKKEEELRTEKVKTKQNTSRQND